MNAEETKIKQLRIGLHDVLRTYVYDSKKRFSVDNYLTMLREKFDVRSVIEISDVQIEELIEEIKKL